MLWTEILSGDFEAAVEESKGVCGLVVGCIEHHGKHLPLGQDVYHAAGVAERAAQKEPIVLFPHMYFGEKTGAGEFKGTVMFSAQLRFDILKESCEEIARNGFKKIILINGHGGNGAMLNNFARSVLAEKKDYMVLVYDASKSWPKAQTMVDMCEGGQRDYFPELTDEDVAYVRDFVYNKKLKGHACLNETAIMMAINGEHVKLERCQAESGLPTHRTDYLKETGVLSSTRFWGVEYPNSYQGDHPMGANERIGKVLLRKRVEQQAEACRLLKMNDNILEWNDEWNKRSEWCQPKI